MNKINALLNKADFFEKLAIHGSRRHALKSLAQNKVGVPLAIVDNKKRIKDTLVNALGNNTMDSSEEGSLSPATLELKLLIDKVDKASDYNSLNSVIGDADQWVTEQVYSTGKSVYKDDDIKLITNVIGNVKSLLKPHVNPSYAYTSIDPAMQKKIRDYAVSIGLSFSDDTTLRKTEDGKLGPVTRGIIEDIKQHFKDSDPYDDTPMGPQGDQELFKTITYLSKNKAPQNNEPEPVDNTSGDIASRLLRRDPKDHITDYNTPMPKLETLL